MAETVEPETPSSTSPTTPTSNAELGVLGAQAAKAEQSARARMAPPASPPPVDAPRPLTPIDQLPGFRMEVLRLAQEAPGAGTLPEDVVKRATTYLAFIKGESDGRAG